MKIIRLRRSLATRRRLMF